jgi:hypothetical protein
MISKYPSKTIRHDGGAVKELSAEIVTKDGNYQNLP